MKFDMFNILKKFERCIIIALIIMMMLTVLFGTIELGVMLFSQLFDKPILLLGLNELLDIFGFFFMVLIGIEILETIKTYLTKDQIHVEVVFLVAMIALARKIIIVDFKTIEPIALLGIAAIILCLASGYFLVRLSHKSKSHA